MSPQVFLIFFLFCANVRGVFSLLCWCSRDHFSSEDDFISRCDLATKTCFAENDGYCRTSIRLKDDVTSTLREVTSTLREAKSTSIVTSTSSIRNFENYERDDFCGSPNPNEQLLCFSVNLEFSYADKCCSNSDFCNNRSLPEIFAEFNSKFLELAEKSTARSLSSSSSSTDLVLGSFRLSEFVAISLLIVCLSVVLVICVLIFLLVKFRRKTNRNPLPETGNLSITSEWSCSGSGSGLPLVMQRTVAQGIDLQRIIGKGRYGEVWMGTWRGDPVAVKIFAGRDDLSWTRETEIYNTTMLRHENLLGFIASDNHDTGALTQLWLIMEYHDLGSLFDFLRVRTVNQFELLRMIYSIANGLTHLHLEIVGTSVQPKPAIAHRDIKSKNILVKRNGECVIGDLGLAVRYDSLTRKIDIPVNTKVGTVRYMAPEVLSENLKFSDFSSFTAADIYSCGLVIWEILTRCNLLENVEEYRLPFFDSMPNDPTVEQAKEIVCDRIIRPAAPPTQHELIVGVVKVMRECWSPDVTVRPTALRLKKTLTKISRRF